MKKLLLITVMLLAFISMSFAQFGDMEITKRIAGIKDGYILEFPAKMDSAHSGATTSAIYSEVFTLASFDGYTGLITGGCKSSQANDSSEYLLTVVGALDEDTPKDKFTVLDTIATGTDTSYNFNEINNVLSVPFPYLRLKLSATVADLGRNHTLKSWIYLPVKH